MPCTRPGAGFDVIEEFHWPCETGPSALKAVLGTEYLPNVDTATLGWWNAFARFHIDDVRSYL